MPSGSLSTQRHYGVCWTWNPTRSGVFQTRFEQIGEQRGIQIGEERGEQRGKANLLLDSDPVTGERLGGDLSERFNDESAVSASATDAQGSARGQADQSSGSADTGSSRSAAASAHDDLPDYARETYRTDDDERFDDSHRTSHGFSHGR